MNKNGRKIYLKVFIKSIIDLYLLIYRVKWIPEITFLSKTSQYFDFVKNIWTKYGLPVWHIMSLLRDKN